MNSTRSFTYEALPGRVVFGSGTSRERLASELDRLGVERVLLIASEREQGLIKRLVEPFEARVVSTFTDVKPNVPVGVAVAARETARRLGADCLLSIGGGSTMGTAKAVALENPLPIVAIPTTYSGSEMTPIWGMTQEQRKTTGQSLDVLPDVVIYDPELTFSLPPAITGPSAMNAMAHCVEAFYASGANPVSSLMAEEGIRALARGLPVAVENPENLKGRSEMLYGAYLAGAALAATGSGLHHKICHVLGGAYDLPHAETHTIVLPHVVAVNEPAMPEIATRIATALETEEAAVGLYDLIEKIGTKTALKDIGMKEEYIDEVVPQILEAVPETNPRLLDEEDVRSILKSACVGRRPRLIRERNV